MLPSSGNRIDSDEAMRVSTGEESHPFNRSVDVNARVDSTSLGGQAGRSNSTAKSGSGSVES